mmetsp:Transcript_1651/g.3554  ORF Transcript_1651/g.3554 Transcript_1651/m.3554 type:complete len:313 (-) Transcript_1651:3670-4608(-)
MSIAQLKANKDQLKDDINLLQRALRDITDDQSIDSSEDSVIVYEPHRSLNSSVILNSAKSSVRSDVSFEKGNSFVQDLSFYSTASKYKSGDRSSSQASYKQRSRVSGSRKEFENDQIENLPPESVSSGRGFSPAFRRTSKVHEDLEDIRQHYPAKDSYRRQSRLQLQGQADLNTELRDIERSMSRLQYSSSPLVRTIAKELSTVSRPSRGKSQKSGTGKKSVEASPKAEAQTIHQSLLREIKELKRENYNLKAKLASTSPGPPIKRYKTPSKIRPEFHVKWKHCGVCDQLLMKGMTTSFCPKHGLRAKHTLL